MKQKILALLCMGVLLTGCTGKNTDEIEKESEIISLDTIMGGQNDTAKEEAGSSVDDSAENGQSENTQDLYMQFINNEISAVIGDDYPQNDYKTFNLERGHAYTYAELGQYVNQSYYAEYKEKSSYDYAQYTYVECPDSDSENFLIKFVGLDIYSPGDDSFAVYVLTQNDGQLYLTDMYECWARSYVEQYRSGLCGSGGSSGAGDNYAGMSVILSDGKTTDIYEIETLSGWWASYVDENIYREVFDENMDSPLNVAIYTIGENKYYEYDISECTDEQRALCETYINRCRDEAGIDWMAEEEVQEAVKKRCALLGVDYDSMYQQETAVWTDA